MLCLLYIHPQYSELAPTPALHPGIDHLLQKIINSFYNDQKSIVLRQTLVTRCSFITHSEHNNLYQSATTECLTSLLTHILTSSLRRVMKGGEKRKEQESLCKFRPILDHDECRPGGHSLELLCGQLVFEMQKLQNLNPVTLHPIISQP